MDGRTLKYLIVPSNDVFETQTKDLQPIRKINKHQMHIYKRTKFLDEHQNLFIFKKINSKFAEMKIKLFCSWRRAVLLTLKYIFGFNSYTRITPSLVSLILILLKKMVLNFNDYLVDHRKLSTICNKNRQNWV